ncbi:HNH endonuclease [Nocardia sp. NPDC051929]|uniref:HNH endonuclease n=1 Tax=Nocardia sp. NPDC051929 TaxID=3364327 RepID=UPI0037C5C290
MNEPEPRCYLCGYCFKDSARDRFLGRPIDRPEPLALVDFVRPRGRTSRDLCIEIDHVTPLAAGGNNEVENLRLACGWCNRVKSSHTNLFDTTSWALGKINHPTLGVVAIPQPLWVLRFVATRGRCESPTGCSARLANSEIFVAPRRRGGALTPTNLAAFCQRHDPWATERYIGVDLTIGRQQRRTSLARPRRLPVPM